MKDELTGRAGNQIDRYALPATEMAKTSLSGYERNKLFFNNQGTAFDDLSGISGVDSIKDSRGFAIWDYDRDGFQDIVLTNINAPVLNLFRNNLGEIDNASSAGMLAVRCVGGNKTAQPSTDYSPRDGIGAKIFVKLQDKTLLRELHCGEGLAAQNSNTLIFGLGSAKQAESIVVLWPSGKQQTIENVDEDALVTFFEDPSDAGGNDFAVEPYRKKVDTSQLTSTSGPATKMQLPGTDVQSEMVMYISMATWCASCREHIPELAHIRGQFDPDQLAMLGVPIDVKDTPEMLVQYSEAEKPAYKILADLDEAERIRYAEFMLDKIKTDALPSTVITNSRGEVLKILAGVPTVSEIRQIISQLQP